MICPVFVLRSSIDLIKENSLIHRKKKKARSRRYLTESKRDTDSSDNVALLTNTFALPEYLFHSLEQAAGDINVFRNTNETDFTCIKQGTISILRCRPLK